MTVTVSTSEAIVTEFSNGYIAISQKMELEDEWLVYLFYKRIGLDELRSKDNHMLLFIADSGLEAAQKAMRYFGITT